MTSHARVSFKPSPVYSRLPRDDEAYVMRAFARHAGHCHRCADPYAVHRRGGSLCSKGHRRALDVAQYVYNRHGQAYSVVDREGYQRVQIEIPSGCEAVRSLLKALERGLRLMKKNEEEKVAPKSYDRTYYVPPRPVSVHQPQTSSHAHPRASRPQHKSTAYSSAATAGSFPTSTSPSSSSSYPSDYSSDRDGFYSYAEPASREPKGSTRASHPKAYKLRPRVYYQPTANDEPIPIQDKYYWR